MPLPALPRRRRRGLTLIELVIGLAVLAVLGTLTVPTMSAALQRQRLRAGAEQLAADLAEARFQAARSGQALHLNVQAGTPWCWAITTSADCGCAQARPCQLQRVTADEHRGLQLLDGAPARFDPAGTSLDSPATPVALFGAAGGQRLRVEVSALGRARVCTPSTPGAAGRSETAASGLPPC